MLQTATFATQAEAIAYRTELSHQMATVQYYDSTTDISLNPMQEQLFIFAAEYPDSFRQSKGRYFFVSTLEQTWNLIQDTPSEKRHFYELIAEGEPCHPYFDVECAFERAPPIRSILNAFVDAVNCSGILPRDDIGHALKINCRDIVLLRSVPMVENKFSLHLIIRLPADQSRHQSYIFPDNAVLGRWAVESIAPFVRTALSTREEIIDLSVYTRNRTLRTVGSTKKGKDSYFVPYVFENHRGHASLTLTPSLTRKIFELSLITNRSACVSLPEACTFAYQQRSPVCSPSHPSERKSHITVPGHPAKTFHPAIDNFVRETIDDFRNVFSCNESNTVCYALKNLRYCGNIGREHKSNGTYVVVSLKDWTVHQRCFDSACKNYKSISMDIPEQVRDLYEKTAGPES